ncbi:MAG: SDR family NAD(P)-dependent oxidoreductase [Burkholderiaceae bacterium]
MDRMKDKVALITGGAGGIGAAAARLFADEGAKVVIADLDDAALEAALREIDHPAVTSLAADVSDDAQMREVVAAVVARHGRLDAFFANAGIEGRVAPLTEYPTDLFDRVFAVNVRGVFLGLKYAIPVMQRTGGGGIAITSSVAGFRGSPGLSAYSTSKHAVVGLMRTAAKEVAASGVRVNTIHPSPIETRMMRSIEEGAAPGAGDRAKERFTSSIPAGRYGTPQEVAQLALFLLSDESRFITGACYSIDGGISAG